MSEQLRNKYAIPEGMRETLSAVFILNTMINVEPRIEYSVLLDSRPMQGYLQHLIDWMHNNNLLDLPKVATGMTCYKPSPKGHQLLETFLKRFQEFTDLFDIFRMVNMEHKEFALANSPDYPDDIDWELYKASKEWEDLRVAVAEFKGINVIEIVFMSFLEQGIPDLTTDDWEMELVSGDLWNNVLNLCNQNTWIDDIDGGRDTVREIVEAGTTAAIEKRRKERLGTQEAEQEEDQESVTEETITEERIVVEYDDMYYNAYLDPYYVSAVWANDLITLALLTVII